MSTTDLVSDVTGYLAAQCAAAAVTGGALAGVSVFDGPQPSAAALSLEQVLWVGHNPMQTGEEFAEAEQTFAFVGDQGDTRDETGWVALAAKHWTGDTTMSVHRDGCKAIVGAVEMMLRGRPQTGGPGDFTLGGLVFWAQVSGPFIWWQQLVDNGAEAYCAFRISYRGRVTTS